MLPVLEFEDLKDYIDHLHRHDLCTTRLTLNVTGGKPDVAAVRDMTFHAVATCVITAARHPQDDAPREYIVLWSRPLLHTDTRRQDIQVDHHDGTPARTPRAEAHEQLMKLRRELEMAGLTVQPGRWLSVSPEDLKEKVDSF